MLEVIKRIDAGESSGIRYSKYDLSPRFEPPEWDYRKYEYPEEQSASNLPEYWYKLTEDSDPDIWVAFTYNESNGVYAMYHTGYDSEIEKYSYRKFLDDDTLQVLEVGNSGYGAASGTYTRESDGMFYSEYDSISKYITDGMLIFKNQCLH